MTQTPSTRAWSRVANSTVVLIVVAGLVTCLLAGSRALRAGDTIGAEVALWVMAALAGCAVIVGSIQVRRHARSLAERTAMLEQLASELSRANRAKGEFLANVSHELRTPLAAIVGFVEMLREGTYGELSPRQAGPIERVEASANHLRELVDDILDLSKLAAARMEVHHEPIVLHPFVLDVASEMESLITEKGLALSISVGTTLPRLRTDPAHLRQILINLLGNAIKYTPSGQVGVRARLYDASGSAVDRAHLPPRLPAAHGVWIAIAVQDIGSGHRGGGPRAGVRRVRAG